MCNSTAPKAQGSLHIHSSLEVKCRRNSKSVRGRKCMSFTRKTLGVDSTEIIL